MPPELTIDQLAEAAASALAARGVWPRNGQVASQPDRRMLRYYAGLGLLDRPVEVRGRTAVYGHRHLLQVVAVKRLQSGGWSLADIQRRLAGADDADLAALADAGWTDEAAGTPPSPARPPGPLPARTGAVKAPAPTEQAGFWRTAPAPPGAPARPAPPTGADTAAADAHAARSAHGLRPRGAVELGHGVTLVLPNARPIHDRDLAALAAAAAPLLAHLITSGLAHRAENGAQP